MRNLVLRVIVWFIGVPSLICINAGCWTTTMGIFSEREIIATWEVTPPLASTMPATDSAATYACPRHGAPDESGEFPAGSINARVRERLTSYATSRQAFSASGRGEGDAAA